MATFKEIPDVVYVIYQVPPWSNDWELMGVAVSEEKRDRLVKYYDDIPKSGRVKWVEYHLGERRKMMKVTVRHWMGRHDEIPAKFKGAEECPEVEITPEDITDLYNTGYEVMLHHNQDGRVVIFLDDTHRLFRTR